MCTMLWVSMVWEKKEKNMKEVDNQLYTKASNPINNFQFVILEINFIHDKHKFWKLNN